MFTSESKQAFKNLFPFTINKNYFKAITALLRGNVARISSHISLDPTELFL